MWNIHIHIWICDLNIESLSLSWLREKLTVAMLIAATRSSVSVKYEELQHHFIFCLLGCQRKQAISIFLLKKKRSLIANDNGKQPPAATIQTAWEYTFLPSDWWLVFGHPSLAHSKCHQPPASTHNCSKNINFSLKTGKCSLTGLWPSVTVVFFLLAPSCNDTFEQQVLLCAWVNLMRDGSCDRTKREKFLSLYFS